MLRTFAMALALTSGLASTGPPTSTTEPDVSTPGDLRRVGCPESARGVSPPPGRRARRHRSRVWRADRVERRTADTDERDGRARAAATTARACRTLGVGGTGTCRAFDPVLEEPADSIVHFVVTSDGSSVDLACTITAALDGASAAQWATPSSPTTADFRFAIGARRGRFYVACSGTAAPLIAGLSGATPPRAVWSFDV